MKMITHSLLALMAASAVSFSAQAQNQRLVRMVDGSTMRCSEADDAKFNANKKTVVLELKEVNESDDETSLKISVTAMKCTENGFQKDANPGSETYVMKDVQGKEVTVNMAYSKHSLSLTDRDYKAIASVDLDKLETEGSQEVELTMSAAQAKATNFHLMTHSIRKTEMSSGYKDSQMIGLGSYSLRLKK